VSKRRPLRVQGARSCVTIKRVTHAHNPIALATAPLITRGMALDKILMTLIDTIISATGAERGTLYLVDGATKTLRSVIANLPELDEIVLDFGQGIAGTVALTQEPICTTENDPRWDSSVDKRTGYKTQSMLTLPFRDSREQVIAVFQMLNSKAGAFSQDDQKRALELSSQAGRVLESTSLYAELSQKGPRKGTRPSLSFRFNEIVGESETMNKVYSLVEKAARTKATVLIQGESGTGKELIARAVHKNSERSNKPFIKVDCTTLPATLIENELFGHEKGAFTGADKTVPGKFEVASSGTLFIDEIGELPLGVQAKLLRAIQDREFERVGGTQTITTDIRIVCATHRDLYAMVKAKTFREDLFYRIRVVPIALPPLRERGHSDKLRLIDHFLHRFQKMHGVVINQITDAAIERLRAHDARRLGISRNTLARKLKESAEA